MPPALLGAHLQKLFSTENEVGDEALHVT